jgi:hypothetical protein
VDRDVYVGGSRPIAHYGTGTNDHYILPQDVGLDKLYKDNFYLLSADERR